MSSEKWPDAGSVRLPGGEWHKAKGMLPLDEWKYLTFCRLRLPKDDVETEVLPVVECEGCKAAIALEPPPPPRRRRSKGKTPPDLVKHLKTGQGLTPSGEPTSQMACGSVLPPSKGTNRPERVTCSSCRRIARIRHATD